MKTFLSDLSHTEFPIADRIPAKIIRPSVFDLIRKDHPEFTLDMHLSLGELNSYREKYISEYLVSQIGVLTEMEKKVIASLKTQSLLSDKIDIDQDKNMTFGQRLADRVASFGGSWTFIMLFGLFLCVWIFMNARRPGNNAFDPFPFILLNLILSCVAALQAPVIMMSQNRQEDKDRERAKKDYMVNLKAELEIRTLHEKMDHLILHQQKELLEIQRIQIEMMNDIMRFVGKK